MMAWRAKVRGWRSGRTTGERLRWAVAAMLVLSAGCGGDEPADPADPPDPPAALRIEVSGRIERSTAVEIRAFEGDRALAPGAVAWSAEPAEAIEFIEGERARLLAAGEAKIKATTEGAEGSLALDIAVPPTIVFDLLASGNRDIYRAALDGGDLTRLTTDPGDDRGPTVAGDDVVFTSFRDGNGELYRIPLGGGSPGRLTETAGAESDPALSPDGKRLAYTSGASGVSRLWTAAADGGGAAAATTGFGHGGAIEASPAWAPDGGRLVFLSTAAGSADLYALAVEGGDIAALVEDDAADVEPAWNADGASIAFASNRDGPTSLYLVDVGSGTVRRLTDRAETDAQPAWLADGRLVYTAWVDGRARLRWLDPADPTAFHEIPLGEGEPGRPAAALR